jgi:hypothetical protein
MRRHIALLTSCLILALAGTAAAQVISVTPQSIDFGKMKQNQIEKSKVTVTNEGGGMLVIGEVKADCGCTVPTLDRKTLAPGETTEIEIQFDSKVFEGKVYKTVQINSNDPDNPVLEVVVTADISSPLLVDPPSRRLGFERALRGQKFVKRAVFTATEDPQLEITIDRVRQDRFEARVINNLDGDPQKAALEIVVPADMPVGQHRDNIRVATNIPDFPFVDIEARAWLVDLLQVSPEQVNYRFRNSLKTMVRVSPFIDGVQFRVTGAEIDLPEISVEVVETQPSIETQILLDGQALSPTDPRAQATRGRMAGTLKIFTDLNEIPVIEVPVTYMIRM